MVVKRENGKGSKRVFLRPEKTNETMKMVLFYEVSARASSKAESAHSSPSYPPSPQSSL